MKQHGIKAPPLSEADLRKSTERYDITLQAIGDAVITTDAGGHVELINPVAEDLTGWTREEARGRYLTEVFEIINEETRNPVEDPVARVLREGTVAGLANHTVLIAKDGREIPIGDSAAPVRDAQGEIIGLVLVFRDQSEERLARKLTDTRLSLIAYGEDHTLDELLTRALDEVGAFVKSPIGFYHFVMEDQETLSLQQWSTRTLKDFCKAQGKEMHYPVKEAGVWVDCVHERKPVVHNDYGALPHKKGMPEGHAEVVRELVVPILREKKIVAILGVGNKPTDYTQKDVEIVSYLADVTWQIVSQKRAQETAEEEKARARNYLDIAGVVLVALNAEGEVTLINRKGTEILGYAAEDVTGRNWFDNFLPESHRDRAKSVFDRLMTGGTNTSEFHENPVLTREGEVRTVAWYNALLKDNQGRVVGTLSSGEDITERKRAEEEREKLREPHVQLLQAQKMESVGRLAGGVAHDFNNMLSVILGYTQLTMDDLDPADPMYENLAEVLNAGNRSARIVRQLLAFARKQTIDPRVLDLNGTVEGMLKMLGRLIGEDIDLLWEPGPDPWPVMMDPVQIDQILANLCVNARDAIPGTGRITIETENVVLDEVYCAGHAGFRPGRFVMLAVSDDGCGMDRETLDKVFDPFFTTKEIGKGTGLGFSTVYGIVKQNEGFINIYSEPDKGTTVRIYLPRHEGEAKGEIKTGGVQDPKARGETVLLVEDDASVLNLGRRILERLGYKVLTSLSPVEAVDLAREHAGEIHLLITDVVMPEMNGRDLADAVTRMRPDIRTLFMSGYTANSVVHHGILKKGGELHRKTPDPGRPGPEGERSVGG